jgi:hypothetical protein
LYEEYGESFADAVAGLGRHGWKCALQNADEVEEREVRDLVQLTWTQKGVGHGVDGMGLRHKGIKVCHNHIYHTSPSSHPILTILLIKRYGVRAGLSVTSR